jgi:hypothetical protein
MALIRKKLNPHPWNYLNLCPSGKALPHERNQLREMTGPEQCFKPIPVMIAQINTHLRGWSYWPNVFDALNPPQKPENRKNSGNASHRHW